MLTWSCLCHRHSEYGQHGGAENYNDWGVGAYDAKNSKDKHHYHSIPRALKVTIFIIEVLFVENSMIFRSQGFEDKVVTSIAGGHLHTVAVTNDNQVFSWGWGSSGS